jgi:hypothetical protein
MNAPEQVAKERWRCQKKTESGGTEFGCRSRLQVTSQSARIFTAENFEALNVEQDFF